MDLSIILDSKDYALLALAQRYLKKEIEWYVYDNKNLIIQNENEFGNGFIVTCSVDINVEELKTLKEVDGLKVHEIAEALLKITKFTIPDEIVETKKQAYGGLEVINGKLKAVICFAVTFMSKEYVKEIKEEYSY